MARKNKNQIPVYKAEAADGLSDIIKANASIAFVTKLEDTAVSQEVVREIYRSVSADEQDQFDLFYLNTILVTTGWNKNDDIFDKADTWSARYSPIHKQFNLEHNQSKIIGHMTSAKAVDDSMAVISDDTPFEELPEKFHILTGAVIYRALEDEEAQSQIEEIIHEIGEGKWYVSMECLFRDFDYGVVSPDGQKRIIARNEETAFLTKHLRRYGGTGKYNDYTVGRVLRNITFSGKGLVRNPANPESVIINDNIASFSAAFADLGYINTSQANSDILPTEESEVMANDNTAEITINELNDKIKAGEATIASLREDVNVKASRIEALEKELNTANAQVEKFEKELTAIKAAEIVRSRKAALLEKNAPSDEADRIVALFNDKSEEDFKSVVDLFAGKWAAAAASTTATETTVVKDVMEDAVVEEDATLAVSETNTEVEPARAAMASVFGDFLVGKKASK